MGRRGGTSLSAAKGVGGASDAVPKRGLETRDAEPRLRPDRIGMLWSVALDVGGAVDGSAFLAILALEVGEIVFPRREKCTLCRDGLKIRPRVENLRNLLKILGDVADHVQAAADLEHAQALGGEVRGKEAAFLVLLLPPGVGKEYMHRLDGGRRHLFVQEKAGVGRDQADISQLAFGQAGRREQDVFAVDLDAEKVG